jgi:hypothetical protein
MEPVTWEAWVGVAAIVAVVGGLVAGLRGVGKRRLRLVPETRALLEQVIVYCEAIGFSFRTPPDSQSAERLESDLRHLSKRLPPRLSSQLDLACTSLPVVYGEEPRRWDAYQAGRTIERAERLRDRLVRRERRGF